MSAWPRPHSPPIIHGRASNGLGPTDRLRRTSTANPTDQMSSKKRPLQSSGRKSPPGKRVRSSEEDGYVHAGNPTIPFSPPQSRHNSIQGIDVPVPTGPTPKSMDGRRVDQSSAPKDNVDPLDTGASPVAHGEIGTPRSGDSTPQHIAPPAPSMVATTAAATTPKINGERSLHALINMFNMTDAEHNDTRINDNRKVAGSPSGSIVSLRLLKQRKNAQARRELDHCKQSLGDSLADKVHAIMANCDRTEATRQYEVDQVTVAQLQGQNKALRIEIQQLKADRDKILSRLDEMEQLKGVRHDTDNLLKQMSSLQVVSQQLIKLEQLPAAVERLEADVKGLEQAKLAHPASNLTAENVQSMIADHTRSKIEPKWTDMMQGISALMNSTSTSTLLEFKKQVESDDWPNQLRTLGKRIDMVDKNEKDRRAVDAKRDENLAKQSQKMDKLTNDLSTSLERLARCERTTADLSTKVESNKQDHDVEIRTLKRLVGEPDSKPGQVAKPLLNRIKDLEQQSSESIQQMESSKTALANVQMKVATFTEAFEKSISDLQKLASLLGEEPRHTKKSVLGRILDLEATYGQFQAFHLTKDKIRTDIDRNTKLLEELMSKPFQHDSAIAPRTSVRNFDKEIVELHGNFINEVNTKIAKLEKRVATLVTDIDATGGQDKVDILNILKEDIRSAFENISNMNQTLEQVEEKVHTLDNRVQTIVGDMVQIVDARLKDIKLEMQSLGSHQQQAQPQVTPQQILTPAERTSLDSVPHISQTVSNTIIPRLDDHIRQFNQVGHRIQVLEKSCQTLQERYDNISTDTMYQRMIKWFIESYGQAQDLVNLTTWLNMNQQQLSRLAPIAQHVVDVVQEMPVIKQRLMDTARTAHETLTKVEQATTTIAAHDNTIAVWGNRADALDRSLSLDRGRIDELGTSVKAILALGKRIDTLDHSLIIERARIDEVGTSISSLSSSVNMDQIRETISTLESTLAACCERITDVKTGLSSLEKFHGENGHLLNLITPLCVVSTEIQQLVRRINDKLPGGGFEFDFSINFHELDPKLYSQLGTSSAKGQAA